MGKSQSRKLRKATNTFARTDYNRYLNARYECGALAARIKAALKAVC